MSSASQTPSAPPGTLLEVGLSLGSNLGERAEQLGHAKRLIGALDGVHIVAASALYETEPVGVLPEFQHMKFLNAVLILKTTLSIDLLHARLSAIERDLGRVRGGDRYAPRALDIDVLYAGQLVSDQPRLTLPHPRWAKRRFVVQPLADVRGELVLPGTDKSVRELLAALPPGEEVSLYPASW